MRSLSKGTIQAARTGRAAGQLGPGRHRAAHGRVPAQAGLHLAWLDAQPVQGDHEVVAAEVFQQAVVAEARNVPGAEHPAARRCQRSGDLRDKGRGGAFRVVPVAQGQMFAGHVEHAGHPGRRGREPFVEHIGAAARQRPADGHAAGVGGVERLFRRAALAPGGVRADLAAAVEVEQPGPGRGRTETGQQVRWHLLAAHGPQQQPGQPGPRDPARRRAVRPAVRARAAAAWRRSRPSARAAVAGRPPRRRRAARWERRPAAARGVRPGCPRRSERRAGSILRLAGRGMRPIATAGG